MKKPLPRSLHLLGAALLLAGCCPVASAAERKISLLLWNTQTRYEQCKGGVIEELRRQGFKESEPVIVVEQADGNKTTVAELAKRFSAAHMNVIVPIGTSAAVAVAAEIKEVPVVFAMVFDPVDSKIALE